MPKHGVKRRRLLAVLEGLEGRQLLTTAVMLYARQAQLASHVAAAISSPATGSNAGTSALDQLGAPTAHEVARRHFTANFVGNFYTGPGQTDLQSLRTQIRGGGTSNQFLHANISIVVTNPTDTTAPAVATAGIFDRNSANTGDVLILDLVAAPGQNPSQPPRHYTWTVNPGSGGIYASSVGQGTLDIQFGTGHLNRPMRAYQSGRSYVKFKGAISTTGLGDNTQFG